MPEERQHTEEEWWANKAAIRDQFLIKQKSVRDIVKHLREQGFSVTEAQLRYRLEQKWKFRRNLSAREWQSVDEKITKRSARGRDSMVVLSKSLRLCPSSVHRQTLRHRSYRSKWPSSLRAASLRLDDDGQVTVCTPPATNLNLGFYEWPEELPWVQFQRQVNDFVTQTCTSWDFRLFDLGSLLNPDQATAYPRLPEPPRAPRLSLCTNDNQQSLSATGTQMSLRFSDSPLAKVIQSVLFQLSNYPDEDEPWRTFRAVADRVGVANLPSMDSGNLSALAFMHCVVRSAIIDSARDPESGRQSLQLLRWALRSGIVPTGIELFLAVFYQDIQAVRLLLLAGAKPLPLYYGSYHLTPLELCLDMTTQPDALRILPLPLELEDEFPPYSESVARQISQELLRSDAAICQRTSGHQLQRAIRCGHLDIARILLSRGADLRYRFRATGSFPPAVADLPRLWHTALSAAAGSRASQVYDLETKVQDGDIDLERMLSPAPLTPEDAPSVILQFVLGLNPHWCPLSLQQATILAAGAGNIGVIKRLVELGVDVRSVDPHGVAPLHIAIARGQYSTCQYLIDLGALDNCPLALHMTLVQRDNNMVRLLTKGGASLCYRPQYGDVDCLRLVTNRNHRLQKPPCMGKSVLECFTETCYDESKRPCAYSFACCTTLLKAGASTRSGFSLLCHAASAGMVLAMQAAIETGFEIRQTDQGTILLNNAIRGGHTRMVRLLLDHDARVTSEALNLAVRHGNWNLVQAFEGLDGIDTEAKSPYTWLELALLSGNVNIIYWALNRNKDLYTPEALCAATQLAVAKKQTVFAELILKQRPNGPTDVLEATAVGIASYGDNMVFLESLLKQLPGPQRCHPQLKDMGSSSDSPKYDFYRRTRSIYKYQTNNMQLSPFIGPAKTGNSNAVPLLLRYGYIPDEESLHWAIHWGFREMAMCFLRTRVTRGGCCDPTVPAIERHDMELLRLLIQRGWSVTDTGRPLEWAIDSGSEEMVSFILDEGADATGNGDVRWWATPLQHAAIAGDLNIARLLLDNAIPAKVNSHRKTGGGTALEHAARTGKLDMVALLLSYGAKTTGSGQRQYLRSVKYADREGHKAVGDLLRRHRPWTQEDHHRFEHDQNLTKTLDTGLWDQVGSASTESECSDSECDEPHWKYSKYLDDENSLNEDTSEADWSCDEESSVCSEQGPSPGGHVEDDTAEGIIQDDFGTGSGADTDWESFLDNVDFSDSMQMERLSELNLD